MKRSISLAFRLLQSAPGAAERVPRDEDLTITGGVKSAHEGSGSNQEIPASLPIDL